MNFTGTKLGLALALFLMGTAQADVLYLASGDRLTGEVDSVIGGKVILKTDFAGTIGVKLDTIQHMESEKTFELRKEDGERVRGQFAVTADAQQFRTEEGTLADLDLSTVRSANENRLGLTDLGSDWNNRFDAGISASSGNTETASQNYQLESTLTRKHSDHRLVVTYNTQEDDGVKTKENLLSAYRYRRFFGERWYGLGNIGYQEDEFKGVDSRWTLGAGAGYQFWDNSQGALSTDLAFNYVFEELDGIKDENPAVRWGAEWNRFFWEKKAEVFYNQNVLFVFGDAKNTIYTGSAGLRFSITDMLTANLRVDLANESDPAPDREKTDVTYVIGIGLVL
jgi:putative salt-induced outer membrane protein YdiY